MNTVGGHEPGKSRSLEGQKTKSQAAREESGGHDFSRSTKRVLGFQAIFALVLMFALAIWSLFFAGSYAMSLAMVLKSSIYGSMLGFANTLLSARSVKRASQAVLTAPNLAMMPIYAGLLNKLILVGGGIALALIGFGLAPIFVVLGYLVGHVAFALASVSRLRSSRPSESSN